MRWAIAFLLALALAIGSFVLMLVMIFPPSNSVDDEPLKVGHFVPMAKSKNSDPARQRQQAPEEPQQVTPPTQQSMQPQMQAPTAVSQVIDMSIPNLTSNISISSSTPNLSGLTAGVASAPSAPPANEGGGGSPGDDSEVIPLNEVLPVYPDQARRRGIEGYVKLAFTITRDGRVENIRVVDSSPRNVFDREARRAATRWRFAPRTEGGISVDREATKTLQFRLERGR
ncbi:energy transducer TonB [Pseudomonas sp. F1_0610]|uniref:energy transducer TonB n=1 Tax=Pseudomonas sp. F1_0610 TaxID=3114284 RepID=UPI0039C421F0